MLLLYEHPLSPYAQKVKIALLEKGIDFEARIPDLFTGSDAAFAAASPRGEIPALVDGDVAVFDSTIILEYIEERWPTPPLLPGDAAARARVRMIEELCDTYYEAINWAVFEIRVFGRASGAAADELLERAAREIADANDYLDRQLGEHPFFDGSSFGRGDLSAAPVVHAAAANGHPPRPGSALAAWLERSRSRTSVSRCFRDARHSMGGFAMLPELIASGDFKRQYRDHRLEWMVRNGALEIVREGVEKGNVRFTSRLR